MLTLKGSDAAVDALCRDTSSSRTAWDRALSGYLQAKALQQSFQRDQLDPAAAAYSAVRGRWPLSYRVRRDPEAAAALAPLEAALDPAQERFNELVGRTSAALRHLIGTQAPDVAAAAMKLRLASDADLFEVADSVEHVATIVGDLERLAAA